MPDAALLAVRNPGTAEPLGQIEAMTVERVAAVVELAQQGQRAMAALAAHDRAALLHRIADLIEAERDELATLLAAENGKPILQTRGEVDAAIRIFRGSAAEATRLFGRQIPLDAVPGLERHLAVTIREPLGVVAALVPFNYPVELYAHKASAAIAAGNAVVVQPPSRCPLALVRIAELVQQAGMPQYGHQLVTGDAQVSRTLAEHPGIAAVSLTGSTAAGREERLADRVAVGAGLQLRRRRRVAAVDQLMPNQFYTFAIERDATGHTLEASGNSARAGQQTLRFHRPFVVNNNPIWHYNTTAGEYGGQFNGTLTQNDDHGSASWPNQWPAGSQYPDYFVIGDLYTNVYEGSASLTDINLYVPATASNQCAATEAPAKAVNGSWTGGNADKWCALGTGKWIRVDLQSNQQVGRFVLRHSGDGGEKTAWNTRDFDIQVSTNGTTWTTVA